MLILDGKVVSQAVQEQVKIRVSAFQNKNGRTPHLTVVIVGEDPASQVYVRNKHIACERVGMKSTIYQLPVNTTQNELNSLIEKLNNDSSVDAILVQFPLPKHLKSEIVLEKLSATKDADGLTYASLGFLWAGKPTVKPCTPHGVMKILEYYKIPVAGKRTVVIGRSNIVGKPMAHLLTEANATVTVCHSKTKNIKEYTLAADLVVVAAGQPNMFGPDYFKKDAVVVDVGIHGSGKGKISGDVRYKELDGLVSAVTPVPGGVGPMTIACLLENTLLLAEKRSSQE